MAQKDERQVYHSLQEMVQCAVCIEIPTEPKQLPCLHVFCLGCLQKSHEKAVEKAQHPPEEYQCPTCRKSFRLTSDGFAQLPTDRRTSQIQDIIEKHCKSNDEEQPTKATTVFCTVCEFSQHFVSASSYCFSCRDAFCMPCANDHDQHVFHKDHVKLDISKHTQPGFCCVHEGKFVQEFCIECARPVCKACIYLNCKSHNLVEFTTTQFADLKVPREIDTFFNDVLKLQHDIKSTFSPVRDTNQELWTDVRHQISDHIEAQVLELRKIESQLLTEVDTYQKTVADSNFDNETTVTQNIEVAMTAQQTLQRMLQPFPGDDTVTVKSINLKPSFDSLSKLILTSKYHENFSCHFVKNSSVTCKDIGAVEYQMSDSSVTVSNTLMWHKITEPHYYFWDVQFFGVQVDCSDIVFAYHNSKDKCYYFKTFNMNGNEIKKDYFPTSVGICSVYYSTQFNQLVLLSSKKKGCREVILHKLETNSVSQFQCITGNEMTITMSSRGEIVTCSENDTTDGYECSFRYYDNNGNYLKVKKLKDVETNHFVFDHLNRLIVSDNGNCAINVYDENLDLLLSFTSQHNEAEYPCGICVDSAANIIVAFSEKHILMYSPNGQFLKCLLVAESSPEAIAFNSDKYLAVGTKNNGIYLYELDNVY